MKFYRELITAMLIIVIMLSFSAVTCFAATTTDNGVEVTLLTNKDQYNVDDSIKVILRVTNNRD